MEQLFLAISLALAVFSTIVGPTSSLKHEIQDVHSISKVDEPQTLDHSEATGLPQKAYECNEHEYKLKGNAIPLSSIQKFTAEDIVKKIYIKKCKVHCTITVKRQHLKECIKKCVDGLTWKPETHLSTTTSFYDYL